MNPNINHKVFQSSNANFLFYFITSTSSYQRQNDRDEFPIFICGRDASYYKTFPLKKFVFNVQVSHVKHRKKKANKDQRTHLTQI